MAARPATRPRPRRRRGSRRTGCGHGREHGAIRAPSRRQELPPPFRWPETARAGRAGSMKGQEAGCAPARRRCPGHRPRPMRNMPPRGRQGRKCAGPERRGQPPPGRDRPPPTRRPPRKDGGACHPENGMAPGKARWRSPRSGRNGRGSGRLSTGARAERGKTGGALPLRQRARGTRAEKDGGAPGRQADGEKDDSAAARRGFSPCGGGRPGIQS
jgi:hypothetical protein